jgi:phosphohistidine phosphatase SixA
MPYLVRHAHASDKHAWTGPDRLRPLSEPGRREAHGVLTQLRDYPITRILSSPAARCLQTVEPLPSAAASPLSPTGSLAWTPTPPHWLPCCWTRRSVRRCCAAMGS